MVKRVVLFKPNYGDDFTSCTEARDRDAASIPVEGRSFADGAVARCGGETERREKACRLAWCAIHRAGMRTVLCVIIHVVSSRGICRRVVIATHQDLRQFSSRASSFPRWCSQMQGNLWSLTPTTRQYIFPFTLRRSCRPSLRKCKLAVLRRELLHAYISHHRTTHKSETHRLQRAYSSMRLGE